MRATCSRVRFKSGRRFYLFRKLHRSVRLSEKLCHVHHCNHLLAHYLALHGSLGSHSCTNVVRVDGIRAVAANTVARTSDSMVAHNLL